MTREEEKEVVKEIIVVADQRKGKAKRAGLDAFGAEHRIIWQRSARLTKRDPRRNAEIAGWSTPLESAGTDVNQITRKLRKRKIRNSKD